MKLSNNRELKWCRNHDEPVIVYGDGSWSCRWQMVVETSLKRECEVVPFKTFALEICGCELGPHVEMVEREDGDLIKVEDPFL